MNLMNINNILTSKQKVLFCVQVQKESGVSSRTRVYPLPSIRLYISIYLLMNVVHLYGSLRGGRLVAKRRQMHMSDIRVRLDVMLQQLCEALGKGLHEAPKAGVYKVSVSRQQILCPRHLLQFNK